MRPRKEGIKSIDVVKTFASSFIISTGMSSSRNKKKKQKAAAAAAAVQDSPELLKEKGNTAFNEVGVSIDSNLLNII